MSSTFASVAFDSNEEEINRKPTAQELAEVPRTSRADCRRVMATADYKRSKLAQQLLQASIAKGFTDDDPSEGGEEVQSMDEIQAKASHVKKLFSDPRYAHDPEYRYEVQQKLKALTVNDDSLEDGAISQPNQVIRVGVSKSPYKGADLAVHRYHKIDLAPNITTSQAPAKKATTREHFSE